MTEQLPDPTSTERIQIAVDHIYMPMSELDRGYKLVHLSNQALKSLGVRLVVSAETDFKLVDLSGEVIETIWLIPGGELEEEVDPEPIEPEAIDEARYAAIGARADELKALEDYLHELDDDIDATDIRRYIFRRRATNVAMAVRPPEGQAPRVGDE